MIVTFGADSVSVRPSDNSVTMDRGDIESKLSLYIKKIISSRVSKLEILFGDKFRVLDNDILKLKRQNQDLEISLKKKEKLNKRLSGINFDSKLLIRSLKEKERKNQENVQRLTADVELARREKETAEEEWSYSQGELEDLRREKETHEKELKELKERNKQLEEKLKEKERNRDIDDLLDSNSDDETEFSSPIQQKTKNGKRFAEEKVYSLAKTIKLSGSGSYQL